MCTVTYHSGPVAAKGRKIILVVRMEWSGRNDNYIVFCNNLEPGKLDAANHQTSFNSKWKNTWIPSRTNIRCGDGKHLLKSTSFSLPSTLQKLAGILMRAIASIDSTDCMPESFFITVGLTRTMRTDVVSTSPSGTSTSSSRSRHSILQVIPCRDSWNWQISL